MKQVIDLGAAAGGWEEGLRVYPELFHDVDSWGIDISKPAIATARCAGHRRIEGDFSVMQPKYIVSPWGIMASPPCQGFSTAGAGLGRTDLDVIFQAIKHILDWGDYNSALPRLKEMVNDPRSALVLEPLRWVLTMRPDWTAWEQVPSVLPIWNACAEVLRLFGYNVWVDYVHAEQYGVAQSRKRAVLIAQRADLGLPAPTAPFTVLNKFNPAKPASSKGLTAPISIAEAMKYSGLDVPATHLAGAGAAAKKTAGQNPRSVDYPSHTITGANTAAWVNIVDGEVQHVRQATVQELGVLQSFPVDYPWQGKQGQQHQQVGDAIPPRLAAEIIRIATKGLV